MFKVMLAFFWDSYSFCDKSSLKFAYLPNFLSRHFETAINKVDHQETFFPDVRKCLENKNKINYIKIKLLFVSI